MALCSLAVADSRALIQNRGRMSKDHQDQALTGQKGSHLYDCSLRAPDTPSSQ